MILVFDNELCVDVAHHIDGYFDDLSVVGDETVHLLLDVAHFRIDASGQAFVDFGYDFCFVQLLDRRRNRFGFLVDAISELIVGTVHMSFRLDGVSAEFTEDIATIVILRYEDGLEVDVQALGVGRAFALIVPSANAVDKTGGVDCLHLFGDTHGIELSPTFVERHPYCQRDDVFEVVHSDAEFSFKLVSAFLVGASKFPITGLVVIFDVVLEHGCKQAYV